MPFLWLAIEDEASPDSLRGYIERNAIALLSNFGKEPRLDPPSAKWLGNFCKNERVRRSGLWNDRHVDDVLGVGVQKAGGSIAKGWGQLRIASAGPWRDGRAHAGTDDVDGTTGALLGSRLRARFC